MDNVKRGDVIDGGYDKQQANERVRYEVLARLEDLVFTQRLFEDGSRGQVEGALEISDLVTYGFTVELPDGD